MAEPDPAVVSAVSAVPSPTERVQAWRDGATLHVRFNNPARHNALSVDMWEAVPALLAQAEADDSTRLVVFSGAGGKAFVSGADISKFESERASKDAQRIYNETVERAYLSIQEYPKPTIAMVTSAPHPARSTR